MLATYLYLVRLSTIHRYQIQFVNLVIEIGRAMSPDQMNVEDLQQEFVRSLLMHLHKLSYLEGIYVRYDFSQKKHLDVSVLEMLEIPIKVLHLRHTDIYMNMPRLKLPIK